MEEEGGEAGLWAGNNLPMSVEGTGEVMSPPERAPESPSCVPSLLGGSAGRTRYLEQAGAPARVEPTSTDFVGPYWTFQTPRFVAAMSNWTPSSVLMKCLNYTGQPLDPADPEEER